jgi:hypothetical protein
VIYWKEEGILNGLQLSTGLREIPTMNLKAVSFADTPDIEGRYKVMIFV